MNVSYLRWFNLNDIKIRLSRDESRKILIEFHMKFHSAQFQGYLLHCDHSGAYIVNLRCIHKRLIQRKKFWVRNDIKFIFYPSHKKFSIHEKEKMVKDEDERRIQERRELEII